ncbi:hypothetical protein GQ42DRAFT_165980 [Ramicandelaber brevisporus]|nr:hypothetical protein GQ42DRAFT_165980 [Ramicandelaber brevisporus]
MNSKAPENEQTQRHSNRKDDRVRSAHRSRASTSATATTATAAAAGSRDSNTGEHRSRGTRTGQSTGPSSSSSRPKPSSRSTAPGEKDGSASRARRSAAAAAAVAAAPSTSTATVTSASTAATTATGNTAAAVDAEQPFPPVEGGDFLSPLRSALLEPLAMHLQAQLSDHLEYVDLVSSVSQELEAVLGLYQDIWAVVARDSSGVIIAAAVALHSSLTRAGRGGSPGGSEPGVGSADDYRQFISGLFGLYASDASQGAYTDLLGVSNNDVAAHSNAFAGRSISVRIDSHTRRVLQRRIQLSDPLRTAANLTVIAHHQLPWARIDQFFADARQIVDKLSGVLSALASSHLASTLPGIDSDFAGMGHASTSAL